MQGHGASAGTADADHLKSVRAWGLLAGDEPGCWCRAEAQQDAQVPGALLAQQAQPARLVLRVLLELLELLALRRRAPVSAQVLQPEAQLVPLLAQEPVEESEYLVVLPEDAQVEL